MPRSAGFDPTAFDPAAFQTADISYGPALISLLDIYTTLQTFSFADYEDVRVPNYAAKLIAPLQIEKGLPDPFFGIQPPQQATVSISNVNTRTISSGARYGEQPYGSFPFGGIGDPTISQIHRAEELHGKRARARIYDLNLAADVAVLDGIITNVQLGATTAQLTIESLDAGAFVELVPKVRILDVYPSADLTSGNHDQDAPVIVVFGVARKLDLFLVAQNTGQFDFGAIRKPVTGDLTLNTVYRGSAVVSPTEYSLIESPTGYYVIRFTRDQRDSSGQLLRIQADITSIEFPRPSDGVKFILTDTTFGLGKTANYPSFVAAADAYQAASYVLNGSLSKRQAATDVLNSLLMRGAVLDRNSAGEYIITVDEIGLHTSAALQLGLGDGVWENLSPDSIQHFPPRIEERVKTLILFGLPDPGFESSETFLLKAQRTRPDNGTQREVSNPFIGDAITLDREADYWFKRLKYGDTKIEATAAVEASELTPNQLVKVSIPNLFFQTEVLELHRMRFEGNGDSVGFALLLSGYDASIFTYVAGSVQAAPGANVLTDYRFTLPAVPTNFSILFAGIRTGSNGHVEAVWQVQATAPLVNVSHLVFQIYRQGETFPVKQIVRAVSAGATSQATFVVAPGLAYDLEVFARNTANNAGFQDGIVVLILNQTAPGDTTPPAQVTGLTAVIGPQKTVLLDWNDLNSPLLESYEINRATNSGFTTGLTVFYAQLSKFTDSGLANGTAYWYRVRGVSRTRNSDGSRIVGTFSASATVTTARIITDDIGDGQVTGGSGAGAKIASLTIVNANINDLSAIKITTGLLTVNPSTAGATAIFVDNAGKIRLKTLVGFPSKIVFEDTSAVERFEITGTVSPNLDILPSTGGVGALRLGLTSRRHGQIELNATTGIIVDSTGSFIQLLGNLRSDQVSSGDATATKSGFKLAIYDSGGTFRGYAQLFN